jgi:hypothetical protein
VKNIVKKRVKKIVKNVRQLHTAANSYAFVEENIEEYILKKVVK